MTRAVVLSGGPTHDFEATTAALVRAFGAQRVAATVVDEPADAIAELRRAAAGEIEPVDVLAVNALRWRMEVERYAAQRDELAFELTAADGRTLDRFVRTGGGLLALHTAVICFDAHPAWHTLCGASWNWETSSHPPLGTVRVQVTEAGRAHPLTAGLDDFVVDDEVYGFLDEVPGLVPLLVAEHGDRTHPLLWARTVGRGRVVTDLLGHGTASLDHPTHREVLARAITWLRDDGPRPAELASAAGRPTPRSAP